MSSPRSGVSTSKDSSPNSSSLKVGGPALKRYFERHGYEQIDRYLELDRGNRYFQRKQRPAAQTER